MKASRVLWDHPASRAAGLAAIAVTYAVVGAMYLRPFGYDLTAFICNGTRWNVQEVAPLPLRTDWEAGYDGQAYYLIALYPWDFPTLREHIDIPSYRYQRILVPLASHFLSLGHPRAVHVVMIFVGVALVLLGTAAFMEWFRLRGVGWGWALLFPLFPGTLHSLMRLTPDAPAVALALVGGWLLARERIGWSAVLFSLAVLTKETVVLVPAGLALHAAWRRDARRATVLAAPVAVLAAWMLVLRVLFGAFPFLVGGHNMVAPATGILEGIATNLAMLDRRLSLYVLVGWFNLLMIAQFLVLAVLSVLELTRRGDYPYRPALLLLVALTACLSEGTWNFEWSITRMVLPVSAYFLVQGLEGGMRPRHKVASLLSLPLAWFMMKWMNLHF